MTADAEKIALSLPDGSAREVAKGTTPLEVAVAIGPRLAKDAIGAELDDLQAGDYEFQVAVRNLGSGSKQTSSIPVSIVN